MRPTSPISVFDALKALAFVGDLSMGQPVDHSVRTAWLAAQLAEAAGHGPASHGDAVCTALLRWSGCTANAPEFADLLGDDIGGRQAMLAMGPAAQASAFTAPFGPMAAIHCEVSGDIARTLGLSSVTETALRHIFDDFDGGGLLQSRTPTQVPPTLPDPVFWVSLAGDLEIFSRVHGLRHALQYLRERANHRYPAALVDLVQTHAADWLDALDKGVASAALSAAPSALAEVSTSLELIADVLDLKLPWMTGYSRRVAEMAANCAARLGLSVTQQQCVRRAGLIHGIGRASVPNPVWELSAPGEADLERLRLVPYWTGRAAGRIEGLKAEADVASYVDERLDGSGSFRGVKGAAIEIEARVLAVALRWVDLQTQRPGRAALGEAEALKALQGDAAAGRLDAAVIAALAGAPGSAMPRETEPSTEAVLSAREVEVLRRISLGESNKEAAKVLGISPSTVRAHLENVFRKLSCSTRAAATLKALTLGLL